MGASAWCIAALMLVASCGRTNPSQEGKNGMPCYGNGTCNPGLFCSDDHLCLPPADLDPSVWCPGLAVLLHFDNDPSLGESDTFVYDHSQSLHHGACAPGSCPIWSADAGIFGGAFAFDGIDDYFEINNSDGLAIDEVTWMAWLRLDHLSGDPYEQTVISADASGCSECDDLDMGFHGGSGRLGARVQSTATGDILLEGPFAQANVWYHLALTAGSSGAALYVDSVLQEESPIAARMGGREVMVIGGGWGGSAEPWLNSFAGAIDEVMILRRALTATEVKAYYDARQALDCSL